MTRPEVERREQIAMTICEATAPSFKPVCVCKRDGRSPSSMATASKCIESLKAADAVLALPADDGWRPTDEIAPEIAALQKNALLGHERAAPMTDSLREQIARAMFTADEASREIVARIPRMTWADIGDQYRNNWRERADAALAAIEASGTHAVAPLEPTEEMVMAGCRALERVSRDAFMAASLSPDKWAMGKLKMPYRYRAALAVRPRDGARRAP